MDHLSQGEFAIVAIFVVIVGIWLLTVLFKLIAGLFPYIIGIGIIWGMFHWFPTAMESIFMMIGVPVAIMAVIVGVSTKKQPPLV